jgi:hypothetical protein
LREVARAPRIRFFGYPVRMVHTLQTVITSEVDTIGRSNLQGWGTKKRKSVTYATRIASKAHETVNSGLSLILSHKLNQTT